RVVGLDPIVAVVFVPERDYARLVVGARAQLVTDAYPDERFDGVVSRVAPTFSLNTRQVRVELSIDNGSLRLKPGMFVRATLELARQESAVIVPYEALTRRDGVDGLFLVEGSAPSVARWLPVKPGIRDGDVIAVHPAAGDDWVGHDGVDHAGGLAPAAGLPVVTLGQELCDDGSLVNVPPIPEGTTVTGTSVVPR
ncbi:MAG: efflux RND transporter periplasmic adaptor subunit, partial [Planctomycetota bacterium]